jgi:LPXTG-motif cell wall-anchored protein
MGNSLAKNKTGVYVGIAAFLIGTGLWFYKRKDKNGKKDSS